MTGTAFSNVIPAFLLPGYSSGLQKWMHWMSKVTADPCTTPVVAWTETITNIKLSAEPVEGQKVFWWWWTTHHLKDLLGHDIHEPPQTSQVSLEDSSVGALMNVKEYLWGIFPYSYIPFHGKSNINYLYTRWNIFCSIQRPFVTPLLLFSHVRPGPHFVMSNYHQASPLATEIWGQHHDGLKSVMWDTLTRHVWCVEWCSRHLCWKAVWRGSGIQKMPLKRIFPSHLVEKPPSEPMMNGTDHPWCSPFARRPQMVLEGVLCQDTLGSEVGVGFEELPWGQYYFIMWIPKNLR